MNFCPNCGAKITNPDDAFCVSCGNKLPQLVAPEEVAEVTAPEAAPPEEMAAEAAPEAPLFEDAAPPVEDAVQQSMPAVGENDLLSLIDQAAGDAGQPVAAPATPEGAFAAPAADAPAGPALFDQDAPFEPLADAPQGAMVQVVEADLAPPAGPTLFDQDAPVEEVAPEADVAPAMDAQPEAAFPEAEAPAQAEEAFFGQEAAAEQPAEVFAEAAEPGADEAGEAAAPEAEVAAEAEDLFAAPEGQAEAPAESFFGGEAVAQPGADPFAAADAAPAGESFFGEVAAEAPATDSFFSQPAGDAAPAADPFAAAEVAPAGESFFGEAAAEAPAAEGFFSQPAEETALAADPFAAEVAPAEAYAPAAEPAQEDLFAPADAYREAAEQAPQQTMDLFRQPGDATPPAEALYEAPVAGPSLFDAEAPAQQEQVYQQPEQLYQQPEQIYTPPQQTYQQPEQTYQQEYQQPQSYSDPYEDRPQRAQKQGRPADKQSARRDADKADARRDREDTRRRDDDPFDEELPAPRSQRAARQAPPQVVLPEPERRHRRGGGSRVLTFVFVVLIFIVLTMGVAFVILFMNNRPAKVIDAFMEAVTAADVEELKDQATLKGTSPADEQWQAFCSTFDQTVSANALKAQLLQLAEDPETDINAMPYPAVAVESRPFILFIKKYTVTISGVDLLAPGAPAGSILQLNTTNYGGQPTEGGEIYGALMPGRYECRLAHPGVDPATVEPVTIEIFEVGEANILGDEAPTTATIMVENCLTDEATLYVNDMPVEEKPVDGVVTLPDVSLGSVIRIYAEVDGAAHEASVTFSDPGVTTLRFEYGGGGEEEAPEPDSTPSEALATAEKLSASEINSLLSTFYASYLKSINEQDIEHIRSATSAGKTAFTERIKSSGNAGNLFEYVSAEVDTATIKPADVDGVPTVTFTGNFKYRYTARPAEGEEAGAYEDGTNRQNVELKYQDGQWLVNKMEFAGDD